MMKKILLMMMMGLVSMTGFAQTNEVAVDTAAVAQDSAAVMKFAYLSYDSVMVVMPEYAQMQTQMADLEKQYGDELKRVEGEFNKQYEAFLDGLSTYPETIRQKRQSELQSMLDKNIDFKKESQKLLKDAKATMLKDMKKTIDGAVAIIAQEKDFAFVLNCDMSAVTFVNPMNGIDITGDVKALIQK